MNRSLRIALRLSVARLRAMRHRDATEAEELHALDYMAYSYLQEAQDAKAKKIVDFAATVRKTNPELEFSGAYASGGDSSPLRI